MTLNPARPIHPRRLLIAAMLMALAASLSSAHWTAASGSPAPAKEAVCKCAHCPGGALCCCHDSACAPH